MLLFCRLKSFLEEIGLISFPPEALWGLYPCSGSAWSVSSTPEHSAWPPCEPWQLLGEMVFLLALDGTE